MSGLIGTLGSAAASLDAQSEAISVISNNIANVNNPEYSEETAQISELGSVQTDEGPISMGLTVNVSQDRSSVLDRMELDYVCDVFREYAPVAARAGLTLAFENTLTAEENVYAFDRVASKAFKIWYDVGNSTYSGFDVPKEIRVLGRERIGQFHFKDKGYLGEGTVDFKGILKAVDDIGFEGYALLETNVLSGDAMADAKRNLSYLRGLMG